MSSKAKRPAAGRKTASGRVLVDMDPSLIYFTHARVRPVFTGCRKLIMETFEEVVQGVTKVTDIPYITVIQNEEVIETVYTSQKSKGPAKPRKKGRRLRDESSDEGWDDPQEPFQVTGQRGGGGKSKQQKGGKGSTTIISQQTGASKFYFSLNNRRLFLFKMLKDEGIIDTIPVQVKPALERERVKYTRSRCVLQAKMMPRRENAVDGDGDGDEQSQTDDECDQDSSDVPCGPSSSTQAPFLEQKVNQLCLD